MGGASPSPSADMRAASTTETVVTAATIEVTVSQTRAAEWINIKVRGPSCMRHSLGGLLEKACHTPI